MFWLILFVILLIVFLVYAIKFRNSCVLKLEDIESLKSNIRVIEAKYLNVLKKSLNTSESVNKSLGSAYGVANTSGCGRFIGGASGSIDSFGDSTNLVFKLANEYQRAQDLLNSAIKKYNSSISTFPSNIIAKMFKFKKQEYIDSAKLNLSMSLKGFDEDDL